MVTHALALTPSDAQSWLEPLLAQYGTDKGQRLQAAVEYLQRHGAQASTELGQPLLTHALATAAILAGMRFDVETVAAALLSGLPQAALAPESLDRHFGPTLARLIQGAARLNRMDALFSELSGEAGQSESLRQMLLAMTDDIRVVLIKLAERVQTLREAAQADEASRRRLARDARELYAPLANRLGVWQLKWELEDLACRYLEPETYRHIARLLDERRLDREWYIERVLGQLREELARAGLSGIEVMGRPKHIASIIAKMRKKHLDFEQVYDVRAVRILVPEVKDCYHALGVVHSLWQPIPGQFDDYISRPKANGYRSLHTAVVGPEHKALEVQIRTFDMHQEAELGVAAHWRYKEGGGAAALTDKIAWLRQLIAWRDELAEHTDLAQHFRHELFQDEVFVLTPQGKVIALPAGATPIDFAYAVHTELGHRCRGAKVDGQLVPLDTPLKTGQRVEILTVKEGGPSRDWLNTHLGFIRTARARAKVRQYFKQLDHGLHVQEGRELLERELARLNLTQLKLDQIAAKLGHARPEDLYAALGRGDLTGGQLARALQEHFLPAPARPIVSAPKRKPAPTGVLVEGEANLLTHLAGCCKPAPPDPIVGYTTQGRGVTIHRTDCSVIRHLPAEQRARLLRAEWGAASGETFAVDVEILAEDRQGLIKDIGELLAQERINATRVNTQTTDGSARMAFTLEVRDVDQLSRFLARVAHVRGVVRARRR
ncbi:MAG: bifunctional (p)ppGpp synthetase/guanosine-3',5'-bis(diphosphate) 3'-pyrophosphohydrolase [Thiobacillaceae bacterium]|nr:bifunctional (p)ppGpp synthetase/guanosine-3',5'-bis(diphosphate) 3'-pyrophosphohydrolase [Thiobacillaceae bacterium]MCX7673479.1 bifunctional (p)ppGpp synthetase/guanosine-3',5'-bis(diphosphate) 3'-pyrophosphohydrolase [Thiobacillaceae bacterium]MDW8324190.1 bifunctional (p)ppGpp synthetase/guanosine-3',5'-bis(diphosphate) 3'-pyrophosphohydrolase [Burkholderiales bacterium]